MSLTASFVRAKHEVDSSVPICDYFEVCILQLLGYSDNIVPIELQHSTVEDD